MSKKVKNTIFVIVIILLLSVAVIISLLQSRISAVPKGTIGNTAGNLYNGGLFCESEDVLYYANPYDSDTLYSLNLKTGKSKKLADIRAEYINAGGKYVFFFGRPNSTTQGIGSVVSKPGIFRVDKNGNHLKAISNEVSQCMILVDNNIYFQHYTEKTGTTFAVMDLSKQKSTELLDYMITPACYYQGSLYYNGIVRDHYLYRYDLTTRSESKIWEGDIWNPICTGQYVYYMDVLNDYRLCRYSISDNTIEILTEERLDSFNLYGDIIYYQVSSATSPCLKRMRCNGTEQVIVADGVFNSICITPEYTYFKPFYSTFTIYKTPTFDYPNVTEFTDARDAAMKNFK